MDEKRDFLNVVKTFRTQECAKKSNCPNKHLCKGYHDSSDQRKLQCINTLITFVGMCPQGTNCTFSECYLAHNNLEKNFHPHNFRLVQCTNKKRHDNCAFNHGKEVTDHTRKESYNFFTKQITNWTEFYVCMYKKMKHEGKNPEDYKKNSCKFNHNSTANYPDCLGFHLDDDLNMLDDAWRLFNKETKPNVTKQSSKINVIVAPTVQKKVPNEIKILEKNVWVKENPKISVEVPKKEIKKIEIIEENPKIEISEKIKKIQQSEEDASFVFQNLEKNQSNLLKLFIKCVENEEETDHIEFKNKLPTESEEKNSYKEIEFVKVASSIYNNPKREVPGYIFYGIVTEDKKIKMKKSGFEEKDIPKESFNHLQGLLDKYLKIPFSIEHNTIIYKNKKYVIIGIPRISQKHESFPAEIKVSLDSLKGGYSEDIERIRENDVYMRSGTKFSQEEIKSQVLDWFYNENMKYNKNSFTEPKGWETIKKENLGSFSHKNQDFVLFLSDLELETEEYKNFFLLPFTAIFDFNSPKTNGKFESAVSQQFLPGINSFSKLENDKKKIQRFLMLGDSNKPETQDFDIEDQDEWEDSLNQYLFPKMKEFFPFKICTTFVVLLNNHNFTSYIIETFKKIKDIFIDLESEKKFAIFIDENSSEGKKILADSKMMMSLNNLIKASNANELKISTNISFKELSQCFKMEHSKGFLSDQYSFPTKSAIIPVSLDEMKPSLEYWDPFDIYVKQNDLEYYNKRDFFLGNKNIQIQDLEQDHAVERKYFESYIIETILEWKKDYIKNGNEKKHLILKHAPCSGASTIVRKVAYKLRKTLPCLIFKEGISCPSDIAVSSLKKLSSVLKGVMLLIIDGKPLKDQNEFQNKLKNENIKAIVLSTLRCFSYSEIEVEPNKIEVDSNKIEFLDLPFESEEESLLFYNKMSEICDDENKEEFCKRFGKNQAEHLQLFHQESTEKWNFSPLFMGIQCFKENFKGTSNLIFEIFQNIKTKELKDILALIALGHYYSYDQTVFVSLSMIQSYMNQNSEMNVQKKTKQKSLQLIFKDHSFVLNILKEDKNPDAQVLISTSFSIISKEIVNQWCKERSENVESAFFELIKEFVHMIYKFDHKESEFKKFTKELINSLFSGRDDNETFSPMLTRIPNYIVDLLNHCNEKFEKKKFPHFHILLSRHYRNLPKKELKEQEIFENTKLALEHIELAIKICEEIKSEKDLSNCLNIKGTILRGEIRQKLGKYLKTKEKVTHDKFSTIFKSIEEVFTKANKAFILSLEHQKDNHHTMVSYIKMVLDISEFVEIHSKTRFILFLRDVKGKSLPPFIFECFSNALIYSESIPSDLEKAKKCLIQFKSLFNVLNKKDIPEVIKKMENHIYSNDVVNDIYSCMSIFKFWKWKDLKNEEPSQYKSILNVIDRHITNLEMKNPPKEYKDLNRYWITKLYTFWIVGIRHSKELCPTLEKAFEKCKIWNSKTDKEGKGGDIYSWYYIYVIGYMIVLNGGDVKFYKREIENAKKMMEILIGDFPNLKSKHLEYFDQDPLNFLEEKRYLSALRNKSDLTTTFNETDFFTKLYKFEGNGDLFMELQINNNTNSFKGAYFNSLMFKIHYDGDEEMEIGVKFVNETKIISNIGFSIDKGATIYKLEKCEKFYENLEK